MQKVRSITQSGLRQVLSRNQDGPPPAMLKEVLVSFNGSTIYIVRVPDSKAFLKPAEQYSVIPSHNLRH